jgi:hypothetical protein
LNRININYYGGSGGFFTLWIVLLASEYRCKFRSDLSLNDIFNEHWNIATTDTWKRTEIWPDNDKTEHSDIDKKIMYFCSPTTDKWNNQRGKRIMLYTDFSTQYKLSQMKNAFLFLGADKLTEEKHVLNCLTVTYENIRDSSWPKTSTLTSVDDFNNLDKNIHKELLQCLGVESTNELSNDLKTSYKNDTVWHELEGKLETADLVIKLQDLIKTRGKILLDYLGYPSNQKVENFIDFWLKKHPVEIRNLLSEN